MAKTGLNLQFEDKRLFLGLPLALRFRDSFAALLSGLKRVSEGVRWVDPEQIHVTLHFFGTLSSARIPEIRQCAREICAGSSPLNLGTGSLGFFPDPHNPRVVWLEVTGDGAALSQLQGKIRTTLAARGFAVESRVFQAHATLGRIKNPERFRIQTLEVSPVAPEIFDSLALYQSVLLPQGPRYEILEKYPFAARL